MARRKKLPKELVEATVEKLSHEGKGIAYIDGKTTFIKRALPNEKVKFRYKLIKKDFAEGIVEEIDTPSSLRVIPKCRHYFACGGCSFQHVGDTSQIEIKQAQLQQQLSHIGKVSAKTMLKPLEADKWGYRNKARLSVRYVEKKQKVLVGFREAENPRFITDIDECLILNPKVGLKITSLKEIIAKLQGFRCIAQVEVAAGDKEVALIFRHLEPLSQQDIELLIEFSQKNRFILFLQPQGPDSIHKVWPDDGQEFLSYALNDLTFLFHPSDFTQVNASLNRLMVSKAIELLAPKSDEKVLDLFCGLGNFSLPLATVCQQVTGVEGSQAMVERATFNARLNGINNAQFFAADLTQPISAKWASQEYDKLLLDPPRSGAKEIVANIEQFNPKRIVYVSCNPATLARDSGILVNDKGYTLSSAGVMDMFAQTAHVESIAVFDKD